MSEKITYRDAGVDIDMADRALGSAAKNILVHVYTRRYRQSGWIRCDVPT